MFAEEMAGVFSWAGEYADAQECARADLAALGAENAVGQFRQAEAILECLERSAQSISVPLYFCLIEARGRAKEARRVAQRYAPRYDD
jgi:hypothetical protein